MHHTIRCTVLAAAVAATLLWGGESRAASVALVPADSSITLADEIAMRVEASGIADLKGFQVVLSFDAAVLQALSSEKGSLLPAAATDAFFHSFLDNTVGSASVQLDAAVLNGSASGSGTLGTVRFRAIAIGTCPVSVSLVDFRDSANLTSTPSATGSIIRVFGPVPVLRSSWSRIKSLYR